MVRMIRCFGRSSVMLVALLALLFPVTALAQGAESPEALVKTLQKVSANHDVPGFVHLVAPSQLPMLAFQTDMAADMIADPSQDASKEMAASVAKLRKKYGVSLEKADSQPKLEVDSNTPQEVIDKHLEERVHLIYDGVDVAGYTGELTALLLTAPQMAGQSILPEGDAGKVAIEGDHATAKIGERDIKMVKEKGRWYIAAPGN